MSKGRLVHVSELKLNDKVCAKDSGDERPDSRVRSIHDGIIWLEGLSCGMIDHRLNVDSNVFVYIF